MRATMARPNSSNQVPAAIPSLPSLPGALAPVAIIAGSLVPAAPRQDPLGFPPWVGTLRASIRSPIKYTGSGTLGERQP